MTAANPSTPDGLPASPPAAPARGLRPGDVDLSDPKTFLAGVPQEYFRVLREQDPVHWQEECVLPVFLPGPGYWALTRYEDVAFVSKHPEIFSTALGSSSLNDLRPRERRMAHDQLIQMDPPGQVLDAIERDLAKGKVFCFPTAQTKFAQIMRRLAPGLVWSMVHLIEGQ